MIVACDKLLKPILSQSECLNIDIKFDIYDKILSSFIQANKGKVISIAIDSSSPTPVNFYSSNVFSNRPTLVVSTQN